MKRSHGLGPLLLFVALAGALLPVVALAAPHAVEASANSTRARQLAIDVREFASAPGVSRAKREKRIATAVRTAVVAATAYRQDSSEVLGAASELAAAATRAAPAYAEVIAKAASLAPGVARIDGATSAIRSAALAGASDKQLRSSRTGKIAAQAARPRAARPVAPVETETEMEAPAATPRAPRREAVMEPEPDTGSPVEEAPEFAANRRSSRNVVDDPRSRFALSLDTTVRRDDNVFRAATNEVADTIVSVAPGVSFIWGDKSRSHGSLGYAESFEHYMDDTAPNVSLGNGTFNYVYEGAASSASAAASYQQLYQANTDAQSQGFGDLIRTDVTSGGVNASLNPWAKIGGRVGASYAKTSYKTGGLIGNSQIGVPVDVVFSMTPKTSLSLGYAYGTQRPEGDGEASKDHYFNVGAQGEFTPKLSGSFNAGYQTRRVGANPSDHLVAFSGNLAYELTPRTGLTLGMNRNFNASALGASTKNTSFRLGLNSELSPQLRLGASVAYSNNEYGPTVFRTDQLVVQERTDHLWEGTLSASYLFTEWFSTSASYLFRHNSSTIPSVDFSGNVLSLSLGLKY